MFLVDSSVWIEYLRPAGSKKIKERLRDILQKDEVACCGIVVVEILRGARNDRDFSALQESLLSLPQMPIDGAVIERASKWGYILDRKGKVASTTDLLISSAAYKKARILHLDSDFQMIASVVGIEEERL